MKFFLGVAASLQKKGLAWVTHRGMSLAPLFLSLKLYSSAQRALMQDERQPLGWPEVDRGRRCRKASLCFPRACLQACGSGRLGLWVRGGRFYDPAQIRAVLPYWGNQAKRAECQQHASVCCGQTGVLLGQMRRHRRRCCWSGAPACPVRVTAVSCERSRA